MPTVVRGDAEPVPVLLNLPVLLLTLLHLSLQLYSHLNMLPLQEHLYCLVLVAHPWVCSFLGPPGRKAELGLLPCLVQPTWEEIGSLSLE